MNELIKEMLDEEIKAEIISLASLAPGSDEKSTAIEDLAKFYKLRIEESKIELDAEESYQKRIMEIESREREEQLKKYQLSDQLKDRYLKIGVEAVGLVLPLIFYAAWMRRGFKFEETGTYTSTTFRGLFNRFKPTNKN